MNAATPIAVPARRHSKTLRRFFVGLVFAAIALGMHVGVQGAAAAEIRLRAECRCQRPVVTLGDVAEILAADARTVSELAAIELFPAPSSDRQRFVRVRQIQDALYLRGVNLAEHRFSGASQIVLGTDAPEPEAAEPRRLSSVLVERARRYVSDAVLEHLRRQVPGSQWWKVDVQLDEEQARQLTAAGSSLSVRGGAPPWLGPQRFEVSIEGTTEPVALVIGATVSTPDAVVVAARPLPRGVLISAADLRLEPVEPTAGTGQLFDSIDQVVGRETAQPISEGKPLEADSLRLPLLVRRGDVVTVFARAAGIRVRTTARARDDGGQGDLVAVESMLDRRRYFARVAGLREVEIFAQAAQTESSAEAKKSPNRRSNLTESLGGVW